LISPDVEKLAIPEHWERLEKACFCRAARVLGNSSIACAFEEIA